MSVTLHTTAGDIKIELFCEKCPRTCENFLALCGTDKYKNCIFHRNIKGFIVQTGDPTNTGKNGQSIWGEPFPDEIRPELTHNARGTLSMASNGPNSNGSQFFITYDKHPTLDGKHTIFGKVIDGFDALEELENIVVDKRYRPVVEQKIKDVTIHANPLADSEIREIISYQYIEEYYEEEEPEAIEVHEEILEPELIPKLPKTSIEEVTVEEVIELLQEHRAQNIVSIKVPPGQGPHPYVVVCCPYNDRHAEALTQTIRKHIKELYHFNDEMMPIHNKVTAGWMIFDMRNVVLHIMSENVREKYDLESLYTGSEDDSTRSDDSIPSPKENDTIPPPREASSS
ncbi:hypothetical protein FO519_002738 [Halicephalobus sp. NKZ332]|nr:hypothetical protein FO519_002738 [Halicephalobus sp. NKZ332]